MKPGIKFVRAEQNSVITNQLRNCLAQWLRQIRILIIFWIVLNVSSLQENFYSINTCQFRFLLKKRKGCDTQLQPGWCLLPRLIAQRGTVVCRSPVPMALCNMWSFCWDHTYCMTSCVEVHRLRGLERTSEVSSTYPWLGAISSTSPGKFWRICPFSKNLHCWRSEHFAGPAESSLLQMKYFAPYANKDAEGR